MNVCDRTSRLFAAFLVAFGVANAAAPGDARPRPGTDFRVLPAASAGGKHAAELIEFFAYRCAHCRRTFETGTGWPPAGIAVLRVPVVFNESQMAFARMYYALGQLKAPTQVHLAVMDALQVQRRTLRTREEQAAFLAEHGVDAARYAAAWDSADVASAVARARSLSRQFDVLEVPTIVVGSQFLTAYSMSNDIEAMRRTVLYLVDQLKAGPDALRKAATAEPAGVPDGPAGSIASLAVKMAGGTGKAAAKRAPSEGKWPAGVEPGNLYLLGYGRADEKYGSFTLLVAARTKAEAVGLLQRELDKKNEGNRISIQRDPGSNLVVTKGDAECPGPNWGATVNLRVDRSQSSYSVCGARTPREAIQAASKLCADDIRRPCGTDPTKDSYLIVSIGHSGPGPWGGIRTGKSAGFGGPGIHSFPHPGMSFSALGASTLQNSYTNLYVKRPEDAIDQFGKACGATLHGKDTHSCWITSRNLECVWTGPLEKQHECVDRKLTADGYLP